MIRREKSLKHLLDKRLDAESMANEYAMDISAAVYERMEELGLKKKDLAERLGVTAGYVTKIIKGQPNLTLESIAKLEEALDMDLAYGFKNPKKGVDADYEELLVESERLSRKRDIARNIAEVVKIELAEVV